MPSQARAAIKASFLKLLNQRPLREITVKDIVQDCGVNRNSFYYHFRDIPSLLHEIVEEHAERIIREQGSALSLTACLETAARFATEHRRTVLHISQSVSREMFEQHLMELCRRTVEGYATAAFHGVSMRPSDREILIRFYQCECFGQVVAWLNDGMRYDMQEEFHRLCQLGEGMTDLFLRRAAEDAET